MNAPEKIYLQYHGDALESDLSPVNEDEITWHANRVFDRDIEYIRVDALRAGSEIAKINGLDQSPLPPGLPELPPVSYDDSDRLWWLINKGLAWNGCYDKEWREGEWIYRELGAIERIDLAMKSEAIPATPPVVETPDIVKSYLAARNAIGDLSSDERERFLEHALSVKSPMEETIDPAVRLNIAAQAMQGLIARDHGRGENYQHDQVALTALSYADALIAAARKQP